jgi:hypothetical protein
MNRNGFSCVKTNSIVGSLFFLSLLLCSSFSYSQPTANFSGVWIQDTTKSDNFYKSFNVKYTISQTLQTFTVKQTFSDKSGKVLVTRDYSFALDGKETSTKKETGLEKNLAHWSSDKKILNTRSTIKYGTQDVGFTETYALSDNGLVLTTQKSDIIPGALSVKQVFKKE